MMQIIIQQIILQQFYKYNRTKKNMNQGFIIRVNDIYASRGCCQQRSYIYYVIHQNGKKLQFDYTEVDLYLTVGHSYKVKYARIVEDKIVKAQRRQIEWQQLIDEKTLLKTQIDNIKRMSVRKRKHIKKAYPRERIQKIVEFLKNEQIICEENLQILQVLDSVQVEGVEKCAICLHETQENFRWPNCQCRYVYHFKCLRPVEKCPTCRKEL